MNSSKSYYNFQISDESIWISFEILRITEKSMFVLNENLRISKENFEYKIKSF